MIPIKYKKRQFEAHHQTWTDALQSVVPSTDLGRGRSASSVIPNLGENSLEKYLKERYPYKHCIFTNTASDALDITVAQLNFPVWYVPSFTWISPINAIAKSGAEIRFLDVDLDSRMLIDTNYDPEFPVLIPHADGLAVTPPKEAKLIVEDAAQSPLNPSVGFGDFMVLSFGSSKRLGLLGQGGAVLTNCDEAAEVLFRRTRFGLDKKMDFHEPGHKSFLDPYNALCTKKLFQIYESGESQKRMNAIIQNYNEASGLNRPIDCDRYIVRLKNRSDFRKTLEDNGVESKVWFKKHAAQWEFFSEAARSSQPLPNSDLLTQDSLELPMNEYLTDSEVEKITDLLKKHRAEFLLN